jgi:hypothetical protein
MADVTVKRIQDCDGIPGDTGPPGLFRLAGTSLGVTAFGMNVLTLPALWANYPEHDHAADNHEEAYVVLAGAGVLHVGAQQFDLSVGLMARVGATERRRIVAGPDGLTILALGGTPGSAYTTSWGQQS